MTAPEFILLFSNPSVSINEAIEINESVIFDSGNFSCTTAKVENVKFKDRVVFDGVPEIQELTFKNCTFEMGIQIKNVQAKGYDSAVLGFQSVNFIDCVIRESLIIDACELERGISIKSCTLDQNNENILTISNTSISQGGITIQDAIISILDLSDLKIEGVGLRIEKSEVKNYLKCTSIVTNSGLSFIKNIIHGHVHVWGGSASGLAFNYNKFLSDVSIQAIKNSSHFTSYRDDFDKFLVIDYDDVSSNVKGFHNKMSFNAAKFGTGLIVNGSNHLLEELIVSCSLNLTGTLQFNSCQIASVTISHDNHKASIVFNYSSFGRVNFDHFNNYGNLIFSSCKSISKAQSKFLVYNSNLGRTQFQNFFFNSFRDVEIIDSLVSNIEFSGMHWFDEKVLDAGDKTSPWRRLREVFRQLKQASEKQNDKFQALKFQALELKAYKKEIEQEGKILSNDGIILWLGQTNDYGLNWHKPVWILVLVSTLLYFPMVISASNKIIWMPACNYSDLKATLNEFWDYSYLWPQLYNPARTLKHAFHDGATLGTGVYFWDMMQRIVLAFFLVQIISAFRKYFKS